MKNWLVERTFTKMLCAYLSVLLLASFLPIQNLYAACGGNAITWQGNTGNDNWSNNSNWVGGTQPNGAGDDAIVVAGNQNTQVDANRTVGCVDVQSGLLISRGNRTLTIVGDYFQAPYANTLSITHNTFVFDMAGTAAQTFEAVDDVRDLRISNTTQVTLKNTFRVRSDMIFVGNGTTYIENKVTFNNTGIQQTIPAGHTVVIKSGAELYARGGLTVNGTLQVDPGAILRIHRNENLTIGTTGILKLVGTTGNLAQLISEATGRTFSFNMDGSLTANNFLIQRTSGGMVLGNSATITQLDNGEFRGIQNNQHAIVLGSGTTVPSTNNNIGFFNDDAVGNPSNVNATGYTGGNIDFNNYTGDVGGAAFETDPPTAVTWTAPAPTELSLTNDAETGEPQTYFDPDETLRFAEFKMTLTQADTATNITQVKVTMTGNAPMSDLAWVRAFRDPTGNKNCNWNNGDPQIGGDLTFTGNPPVATIDITPGDVSTNGPLDQACIHIQARTTSNPTDGKTVQFSIQATGDVTNSSKLQLRIHFSTAIVRWDIYY